MSNKKPKYYAVRSGRKNGIFTSWVQCEEAVKGFSGAVYKSFLNKAEAQAWFEGSSLSDQPFISSNASGTSNSISCSCAGAVSGTIPTTEKPSEFIPDYDVYTDGSYINGQYAWAYAFVKDSMVDYEDSGVGKNPEAAVMRNVAGEIAAVLYAVKKAAQLGVTIRILHDYAGIAFWVTGEWRAKNEFTQTYAKLMNHHKGIYIFEKVQAHSGNQFNDYVDKKAKIALGIIN